MGRPDRQADRQTDTRRSLIPALASVARVKTGHSAVRFRPKCLTGHLANMRSRIREGGSLTLRLCHITLLHDYGLFYYDIIILLSRSDCIMFLLTTRPACRGEWVSQYDNNLDGVSSTVNYNDAVLGVECQN